MKIDRKVIGIGIGIVLVLAIALILGVVMAQTNEIKCIHGEKHKEGADHMKNCPMHKSLTEEQREAISQKRIELKEEGASPEEMRTAMQDLFEQLGIEHNKCDNCGGYELIDGSHSENKINPEHKANCPFHKLD